MIVESGDSTFTSKSLTITFEDEEEVREWCIHMYKKITSNKGGKVVSDWLRNHYADIWEGVNG